MNKLFIIGNGFDLAHGLKTSYADFLLWYIIKAISNISNNVFDDGLIRIKKLKSIEPITRISDFTELIRRQKINVNYHTFINELIADSSTDRKWVDIEFKYYQALVGLYKKFEKNTSSHISDIEQEVTALNGCLSLLKQKLREYLLTLLPTQQKDSITRHIEMEISPLNYDKDEVVFLIFNYTNTIELYKPVIPQGSKIIFIHGTIKSTVNPLIFGYGDYSDPYYEKIEQLNSDCFLDNFKNFEYFRTRNYQILFDFIHNGEFDAIIMGHSCGVSDRLLLKGIFEHEHCKTIKIFHYKKADGSDDFTEKTKNISRNFSLEKKDAMLRRIIPFYTFDAF